MRTDCGDARGGEFILAGDETVQLLRAGRGEGAGDTQNDGLAGKALEINRGGLRRVLLQADSRLEDLALLGGALGQERHDGGLSV